MVVVPAYLFLMLRLQKSAVVYFAVASVYMVVCLVCYLYLRRLQLLRPTVMVLFHLLLRSAGKERW